MPAELSGSMQNRAKETAEQCIIRKESTSDPRNCAAQQRVRQALGALQSLEF
jgi:hypothetical protein